MESDGCGQAYPQDVLESLTVETTGSFEGKRRIAGMATFSFLVPTVECP
jgi:hypothetical protein